MLTLEEIQEAKRKERYADRKTKKYFKIGLIAGSIFLLPTNLGSKTYDYFVKYANNACKQIISSTAPEKYEEIFKGYYDGNIIKDEKRKNIFVEFGVGSENKELKNLEKMLGEKTEGNIDNQELFEKKIEIIASNAISSLPEEQRKNISKSALVALICHESAYGTSNMSKELNNYAGIKDFSKSGYLRNTIEEINGEDVPFSARFKKFDSPEKCIDYIVKMTIVQKSKHSDPYKMIDNLQKNGYASASDWAKEIKRKVAQMQKSDSNLRL